MASITKKPNGPYLVRISAGKNDFGKPVTVSKIFTPSKPTLSYASLQKDLVIVGASNRAEIWAQDRWEQMCEQVTADMIAQTMDELDF